ncbi:hypothetical protein B0H13DRAFT_1457946, partial [Mycena leptocephala]
EQSINLYRKLANQKLSAHGAPFADALYNLSCRLFAIGQYDKALCMSLEEVQVWRKLREKERLATCLDQLSRCLGAMGRMNASLNAAEEAVRIRRRLIEENMSRRFECQLADSLNNLACCLSLDPRGSQNALDAAREAVSIQRGLARDTPARTFNLRLGVFLHNFSGGLSGAGRHEEALRVAEEVLRIQTNCGDDNDRALALSRVASLLKFSSPALNTALVRALLRLSTVLLSVGKDEEALRMAAEAAQMGSGLAKDCFSACLYHLSLCLHAGGKSEQGMNCAKQCVDLRRELVKEYGTWQFTEKLADSLFNLSLYTQPHSPGALQVVREAVKLQQELEGYIPAERFNQRLADGLQNLAALALLAGKAEEAL